MQLPFQGCTWLQKDFTTFYALRLQMREVLTNQKNGKSETKQIMLTLRHPAFVTIFSLSCFSSEATVAVDDVVGGCVVTCAEDLNCSVEEYTARGINYFYFLEVRRFSSLLFNRQPLLLLTRNIFFFPVGVQQ